MTLAIVWIALAAIVGVAILAATGGAVAGKIYRVLNPPMMPENYQYGSKQAPRQ